MSDLTLLQLAAKAALARSLAQSIDDRVQALLAERGADANATRVTVDARAWHGLMALAELAGVTSAQVAEGLNRTTAPDDLAGSGQTPDDNPDDVPR